MSLTNRPLLAAAALCLHCVDNVVSLLVAQQPSQTTEVSVMKCERKKYRTEQQKGFQVIEAKKKCFVCNPLLPF